MIIGPGKCMHILGVPPNRRRGDSNRERQNLQDILRALEIEVLSTQLRSNVGCNDLHVGCRNCFQESSDTARLANLC